MSIAALSVLPSEVSEPAAGTSHAGSAPRFVRRRGTIQQGRALETLGHAVEYLVDSTLFETDPAHQAARQEATRLLMRLSRSVFEECPEVLSTGIRLRRKLSAMLERMATRR